MKKKSKPKLTIDDIRRINTGDGTSVLSEPEQRYLAMIRGEKPRNKSEAIMQKKIIKMKRKTKSSIFRQCSLLLLTILHLNQLNQKRRNEKIFQEIMAVH